MSIKFEVFGVACIDCVMAIANDDYTGMEDAREAEVRAGLEQAGYLIVGDEVGFTWGRCDVCGSGGGDKHEVLCEVNNETV
jgi:Holliday junction resolvase-like predicted endonuclease